MISSQRLPFRFCAGVLALAVLLSACGTNVVTRAQPTAAVPIDIPVKTQAQLRDYDAAVRALRDNYIDSQKVGATWQAKAAELRKKIDPNTSNDQFTNVLFELIDTLNDDNIGISASPVSATVQTAGIGVLVDLPQDNRERVLVLTVFDGSGAQAAGIKPHDAIIAVEGRRVTASDATVLNRIRGAPNSSVNLTVQTPGQSPREVRVTRRLIPPNSASTFERIGNTRIALLTPSATLTGIELRDEVAAILRKQAPLDGLILDLRVIRGADFPIQEMLSLFVNGTVANEWVRGKQGGKIEISGKSIGGSQDVPLIVLLGDVSVGNVEIFAGVLQSMGRARVVGSQTIGNTAISQRVTLPNSGLILSIPNSEYRSNKNVSWLRKGVNPDINVNVLWEQFSIDNDPQLQAAIAQLTPR